MKKILLGLVALTALAFAEVNLNSCFGCHGKSFEKKALGKSLVVADMNTTAISIAMIGYKEKTYGGKMKSIMYGQVSKYTNEELNASAESILKLSVK